MANYNRKAKGKAKTRSQPSQKRREEILKRTMDQNPNQKTMNQQRDVGIRELKDCTIRAVEGDGRERTFRLSFSSEAPYDRWFGTEILDHSEGAVNLERLNSIGVMLYNHDRDAVIGKVERAWLENGRGEAEITFDSDDESEKIYQKVKNKTLKGVSVGYLVDSWEEVMPNKQSADGRFTGPCSIARKWTPFEISIVSVPADPSVGVGRSMEGGAADGVYGTYLRQLQYNLLTKKEELTMTREQMLARMNEILSASNGRAMTAEEQAEFDRLKRSVELYDLTAASAAAGQSRAKDDEGDGEGEDGGGGEGDDDEDGKKAEAAAKKALEAERSRVRQIQEMCSGFGIDSRQYVDNGDSVDSVRAAVLEHLQQNGAPIHSGIRGGESGIDKFVRDVSDALVMRGGIHVEKPAEGAGKLVGMSLKSILIEAETLRGQGEGLNRASNDELFQRAFFNPESVFPAILDQTIEKAYKEGHKNVEVTFDKFTKKGSLPDFKTHDNYYIAGPVGEFLEVPESGELKHDVFGDEKLPTRKLKTYGRQFTLSRKAFIDDDIGLVTSLPARYAASARKTINKQVFSILLKNPAIYDGVALFHANHKNMLKAGTGITQEAVQTMIMALATQKDQFGEAIIINPAQILVPSGLKFDMYTLFNSPYIETSDNTQAVNPLYQYRNGLEVIEDPTINAMCGGMGNVMPWFMFGSSSDCDGIEVDYLNGQEIPTIKRSETVGQLGFVWDIFLDWGISVMDYRSMVKNPGVKVDTKLELA